MRERNAQLVLLVRAFEEVDREGDVLATDQRTAATRRALMVTTREGAQGKFGREGEIPNDETVMRRARLLFNALYRRIPTLYRVLDFARLRSLLGPGVIVIALGLGLAASLVGPWGRVNLLSYPLLALLVWNVAVYVVTFGVRVMRPLVKKTRWRQSARDRHPVATGLANLVVRVALWRSRFGWRKTADATDEQLRTTSRAFVRFCALWHRLAGPLLVMRVRRTLHLAAMALVAGVVFGMHLWGVLLGYPPAFATLVLEPAQVQAMLGWVLAPAGAVLGAGVPDVTAVAGAAGPADTQVWIRLWAMTALLFVVLPRAVLFLYASWRCSRLASNIPVDLGDGYYRRLLGGQV